MPETIEEKAPQPLDELVSEIDHEMAAIPEHENTVERISESDEAFSAGQYIRFLLDDLMMGVPLSSGLEIGHLPDITPLPNLPDWVLGISNIRGDIISMVDFKGFLGWPTRGPQRGQRFIVVHDKNMKVGLTVDAIRGILSIDRIDSNIQESPFERGELSAYVSGIVVPKDQPVYILDADKLLSSPRMTGFRAE